MRKTGWIDEEKRYFREHKRQVRDKEAAFVDSMIRADACKHRLGINLEHGTGKKCGSTQKREREMQRRVENYYAR